MLVVSDPRLSWAELLSCADIFLAPAVEDICTEPIAQAMAAGVAVVASAVRSIAELVADKSNGLLVKPGEPRALAARLLAAIEDEPLRRKVADLARGQAYEVFGVRAFVENYERLYANVVANGAPGEGIADSAMVA